MVFVKASFMAVGSRGEVKGIAFVDSGAWYTVIDEGLAEELSVRYTGLAIALTSFSRYGMRCREAVLDLIAVEGRHAPSELVAICRIPSEVRELLRRHGVDERVVIGIRTLERLGLAIDPITHKLIESPGVLMI